MKLKEVRKRLVCVFFGEGGWEIVVECLNIPPFVVRNDCSRTKCWMCLLQSGTRNFHTGKSGLTAL